MGKTVLLPIACYSYISDSRGIFSPVGSVLGTVGGLLLLILTPRTLAGKVLD